MFDTTILLMFFTTSILLALAPGPDNLFVMTQAAQQGRKAGLLVTLGLCSGLLFHTAAVTLGLAALFKASATAFTVLKLSGAGYLLYLAVLSFKAGAETGPLAAADRLSAAALYRRGIIMNITNPKVSIFFLAFLPQFADPSKGHLSAQFLLLGVIFMIATIIIFGAISILAGVFGEHFRKSAFAQKVLNRAAAGIFAGLALKLALAQR
ncbi:MAG: LysE family translocator [Desulfuromonadaceae bacterium]|nr:LysE family translocator [Desulfuromonadaceae bacterium]MDD2848174.1 LysE family translocator [Desulfuromonadaceae bacterium]MDD4130659.1 LysE family translocator [Desulfuromonadaceae bacterium]